MARSCGSGATRVSSWRRRTCA